MLEISQDMYMMIAMRMESETSEKSIWQDGKYVSMRMKMETVKKIPNHSRSQTMVYTMNLHRFKPVRVYSIYHTSLNRKTISTHLKNPS